ncbi:MAG: hypothetical protein WC784_05075 [Candidatus Shapirobacteria bacterium]|jgi:hypothetical protein
MNQNKITPLGYLLVATFFILLSYAGWIYTKSIDWNVLKRMESSPLTLPVISATPTNPKK